MKTKWILLLILIILISVSFCGKPEKTETFSFVFMTDVHLMPEKNAPEGFNMAIRKINSLQPDFVISGGDQIGDALEQPFERADRLYRMYSGLTGKLEMPIYNVLGNHDIFGVFKKSGVNPDHPEFGKKMFENRLNNKYYSFDHKGWHFIILDSIKPTGDDSYTGEIDADQFEWLKEHVRTLDQHIPTVIAAHAAFYTIMPQIDDRFDYKHFTIGNRKEVLDLFRDHNLKLVLQGHVHNYEAIFSHGIWFITGGAVCGGWWEGPLNGMEEGFLEFHINGQEFTWQYIDTGWESPEKLTNKLN